MKFYGTVELSKGYAPWKAMLEELKPRMVEAGLQPIFYACEVANEKSACYYGS